MLILETSKHFAASLLEMAMLKSILLVFIFIYFTKQIQLGCSILSCPQNERNALFNFKQGLIDQTNRLSSWVGKDCCKWEGVTCDNFTGHVLKLDLRNPFPFDWDRYDESRTFYDLRPAYDKTYTEACLVVIGEVNPSLLELKHLNYLDLSWNNFSGIAIPKFFGLFPKLTYLNLSTALFGGIVPHHLGNLSALHSLDLSVKVFSHPSLVVNTLHWTSSLYSLQILDMSGIDLSNIPLDSFHAITSFPSLLELHFSDCMLDINLLHYSSLGNLTSLTILELSANFFKGPIPSVIRNLTSLKVLLSGNKFTSDGPILGELKNLNKLEVLDMSGNMLAGKMNESSFSNFSSPTIGDNLLELYLSSNKFIGYLPNWLHQLKSLNILKLSANSFEGEIPTSFSALQSLKELDLSMNQLSGHIPTSLGKMSALTKLSLASNKLSGDTPSSLGELSNLITLDLGRNQLSGDILVSLGNLSNLKRLNLIDNQFNGSIPESLGQLSQLNYLHLGENRFHGSVPKSLGQLSQLTELYLRGFLQFQGVVSELHFAKLSKLIHLDLSNSSFSFRLKSGWVPPFQLHSVHLDSCFIGPQFPDWLQTQTGLEELLMSNTSITDYIPNWFQNLTSLVYVDLSGNQIFGKVPKITSSLFRLLLSSNRLEGSFPLFPSSLEVLDLSNNNFTEPVRADFGYSLFNLIFLSLSNNMLTGTIPKSLCKMLSLSYLDFSQNQLSGVLPHCWGDLQNLKVVDLTSNSLSGTIQMLFSPRSMYLRSLHLSKNNFQGELPSSLQNCKGLSILDASDNNFSGGIPTWIGQSLHSLRILKLSLNKYNGGLSPKLCYLNELQILDVSSNNLSGNIPHCFGNMLFNKTDALAWAGGLEDKISQVIKGRVVEYTKNLRYVTNLDLSNNNFVGKIPKQLTNLSKLFSLNLSWNHLTGSIPMKIGQMGSLESLDLSNNGLSGAIPQSISAITTISYLNLSNNNLSGPIPFGNQLQTFIDPSIYEGNSELCGFPLEKKCLYIDRKGKEKEEGDGNGFIAMWFYIGMACGCVVGFWGFCGVLLFKKSWRYAYFQFINCIVDQLVYTITRRNV